MKRCFLLAFLFVISFVLPWRASAQAPTIGAGGIINAASNALPGMPNSGIAQGSMFLIFGDNMGPAALVQASTFPLPTSAGLAGTSVRATVGGTTVDCIMFYTSKFQVAAALPSNTPVGAGTLTVTYNGQTSAPASFTVVRSAFGTFAVNSAGSGPGVLQNFISQTEQPVNGLTRPARPGQTLILWGTGLGPLTVSGNEAGGAGFGVNLTNVNVRVYVGDKEATVTYRGRSGCCVGVDQVVFTVPSGVSGCYVPVSLVIDNVVSNYTSISVAASGNTCSDPNGFSAADLQTAQTNGSLRYGALSLSRSKSSFSIPGFGTINSTSDIGSGLFFSYNLTQLETAQGTSPALGSCMVSVYRVPGSATDPILPNYLDAGAQIGLTGPGGAKQLVKSTPAGTILYFATLGQTDPLGGPGSLYLSPGNYTFSGTGGTGVGPFQVVHNHVDNFTWTNEAEITAVARSNSLTVRWTGGDPSGFIYIAGSSTNVAGNAGASFYCFANQSAGSFSVPPSVLLAIPVSTSISGVPSGALIVGSVSSTTRFAATGIDFGFVNSLEQVVKLVDYQ